MGSDKIMGTRPVIRSAEPAPMPTPREFAAEVLTLLGVTAATRTGRIPERWEWPADVVQAVAELIEAVAGTGPRVDALERVAAAAVDVVRPQSLHSRLHAEGRLARALSQLEEAPAAPTSAPQEAPAPSPFKHVDALEAELDAEDAAPAGQEARERAGYQYAERLNDLVREPTAAVPEAAPDRDVRPEALRMGDPGSPALRDAVRGEVAGSPEPQPVPLSRAALRPQAQPETTKEGA